MGLLFLCVLQSRCGGTLVQCIGDNACFCCGGRCTLVERNYALVYVQWVKFFKICFFGLLYFTCTVITRLISYTLRTILSHVHLNKHTQRALYSSVNCFPLHSTYFTSHQNHRLMANISPILPVIVSHCASI